MLDQREDSERIAAGSKMPTVAPRSKQGRHTATVHIRRGDFYLWREELLTMSIDRMYA